MTNVSSIRRLLRELAQEEGVDFKDLLNCYKSYTESNYGYINGFDTIRLSSCIYRLINKSKSDRLNYVENDESIFLI